jgi:hypothetical protein
MIGTVSDGIWSADLSADRAVFDGKGNIARQAGLYTLLVVGSDSTDLVPSGDGFGTVSITTAGKVKLAGSLADGSKITQSAVVSKYGQWPVYLPLDGGKGCLVSWITFSDLPDSDLRGEVGWIKPSLATSKVYRNGFSFQTEAIGSRYAVPAKGVRVLDLNAGQVVFAGGDLAAMIENPIILGPDNKVSNLGGNKLTLSINTTTGSYNGTFANPATGKSVPFGGVVLQKMNEGGGSFLGTIAGLLAAGCLSRQVLQDRADFAPVPDPQVDLLLNPDRLRRFSRSRCPGLGEQVTWIARIWADELGRPNRFQEPPESGAVESNTRESKPCTT